MHRPQCRVRCASTAGGRVEGMEFLRSTGGADKRRSLERLDLKQCSAEDRVGKRRRQNAGTSRSKTRENFGSKDCLAAGEEVVTRGDPLGVARSSRMAPACGGSLHTFRRGLPMDHGAFAGTVDQPQRGSRSARYRNAQAIARGISRGDFAAARRVAGANLLMQTLRSAEQFSVAETRVAFRRAP